jgi:hypothetical protein
MVSHASAPFSSAAPAPTALSPFAPEAHLQGLALSCAARWHEGVLELHYRLSGPLQRLRLPSQIAGEPPQRRDQLWQSTCFEAFIGRAGQPGYWELNLAPNGDWNCYALNGYRQGLQPEPRIQALPFVLKQRQLEGELDQLELTLSLPIGALIPAASALELSVTAVLDDVSHGCSYWAWLHSGPEPDFHRRESFLPLAEG